jgi:ABC-2 type transport system ATP-binding protein
VTAALATAELGKRYGAKWALRDCAIELPEGRVAALVGPNGAGKTTLLHLAVGLSRPTSGSVAIFGASPHREPLAVLPNVGFLAQDHPLYRGFTVDEMLRVGRVLNPAWDDPLARRRLRDLDIPPKQRIGTLSGGQKAQVALALALAKRPRLLLLDEPIASLDPLARREFLQSLMAAVSDDGLTVVLSSHILADLERVCDHLIILSAARVQLHGAIDELLAEHCMLIGPRDEAAAVMSGRTVLQEWRTGRTTSLLVRGRPEPADPSWVAEEVSLEEIVLAYLGQGRDRTPVVEEVGT